MTHQSLKKASVLSVDVWETLITGHPEYAPRRTACVARHFRVPDENISVIHPVVMSVKVDMDLAAEHTGEQFGFTPRIREIHKRLSTNIQLPILTPEVEARIYSEVSALILEFLPPLLEQDLLDTLTSLKEMGLRIAIISNTGFIDGEHMRAVFARYGIWQLIDYPLFSNETKLSKPNPEIYRLLAQRAEVNLSDILHIGDNKNADYLGARGVGAQALHYTTKPQEGIESIVSLRDLLK